MNEKLFLEIASAVISIAVALVTGLLIPYLKTKINSDKLQELDYFIKMAVRCAEQLYSPDEWKEKKAYVTNYVTDVINNTLKIKITPEELDALIEGAVNQIKHSEFGDVPYVALPYYDDDADEEDFDDDADEESVTVEELDMDD